MDARSEGQSNRFDCRGQTWATASRPVTYAGGMRSPRLQIYARRRSPGAGRVSIRNTNADLESVPGHRLGPAERGNNARIYGDGRPVVLGVADAIGGTSSADRGVATPTPLRVAIPNQLPVDFPGRRQCRPVERISRPDPGVRACPRQLCSRRVGCARGRIAPGYRSGPRPGLRRWGSQAPPAPALARKKPLPPNWAATPQAKVRSCVVPPRSR